MIKTKSLLSISLGMLSAFALSACLTSEDKGSSSEGAANFSYNVDVEVLNITQPQGSAAGTIITRSIDSTCDEGDLVVETSTDTSKYVISGGNLFLWSQGDCQATKLSGSSSTIVGTWTGTSLDASDSVPLAFRPLVCDSNEFDDDEDSEILGNTSVEYKVSSTQINGKVSGTVCFAKALSAEFTDSDESSSTGFSVETEGCTTLKVRNPSNKVGTFTTGYKNDSVTIKFTYGNKVCKGALYLGLSNTAQTCSDVDDDDNGAGSSFAAYNACVFTSGFYGDFDLEKKSFAKKMSLALKPGAGGPF